MPKSQTATREEKPSLDLARGTWLSSLFTWDKKTQWSVLFWITAIVVTFMLLPPRQQVRWNYDAGDIARSDIRAHQSFLVEDPESTQARKLEAEASVLAVYDFDRRQESDILVSLKEFFKEMRDLLVTLEVQEQTLVKSYNNSKGDQRVNFGQELELFRQKAEKQKIERVNKFIQTVALEVTYEQMSPLISDGFTERTEAALVDSFKSIVGVGIVSNLELLHRERGKGITVRTLEAVAEEMALDDFSAIFSLDSARKKVRDALNSVRWSRKELPLKNFLLTFSLDLVRPNLTFNRSETEDRKKKAVEEASAVYHKVKKGEIIVRAGDPVSEDQLLKIESLNNIAPSKGRMANILGTFILTSLILFIFYRVLLLMVPEIQKSTYQLVMLVVIIVMQAGLTRIFMMLTQAISATNPGISEAALGLAIPFAAGAMLSATLFPTSVGVLVAGVSSIFSGVIGDWSFLIFVYSFVGGIVAAFSVINCRQRFHLVKAGLLVGAVNVSVAIVVVLNSGELFTTLAFYYVLIAFGGGVGVSLVVSLVLPLMETVFGVATDMKLMELANLNQPALKEMIVRAPGSYHHSVLVGSIAEAAAEEIGANPLLARVAASYHDIGKMNKPEYFIENQSDKDSRHERLSPSMSALILTAHVKEGVEIAKEENLPRRIIDIIKQHHGTRLITYFYNKAMESEDPSVQSVNESDFRYLGPKPRSREAAIIMLADAVEAASKVLSDPTPARIRGLVQKIINEIFIDGQLDEANLTLKDLHRIARSFTHTLTGIFHHRIDYPQRPLTSPEKRGRKRKKENGAVSEQDSARGKPPEDARGSGAKDIKRLGQA